MLCVFSSESEKGKYIRGPASFDNYMYTNLAQCFKQFTCWANCVMLPAHFYDVNGDVVTMLGITVASCYVLFVLLLCSCRTRFLLGIARSVAFIIPRLLLYFVFDSGTKFDFQIVIYRR